MTPTADPLCTFSIREALVTHAYGAAGGPQAAPQWLLARLSHAIERHMRCGQHNAPRFGRCVSQLFKLAAQVTAGAAAAHSACCCQGQMVSRRARPMGVAGARKGPQSVSHRLREAATVCLVDRSEVFGRVLSTQFVGRQAQRCRCRPPDSARQKV